MGNDISSIKELRKSASMASDQNTHVMKFHQIHGSNIVLRKRQAVAVRSEGFNNGITFTSRPVMILEPVVIRINETAINWSGALRIGFTIHDPKFMKSKIPQHSCPELVSIPGNWAKALSENVNKTNCVIAFHVDMSGNVYYTVNNGIKKFLLSGVQTDSKLWGIVDVYGNTVEIELIGNDSDVEDEQNSEESDIFFHEFHGKTINLMNNNTVATRQQLLHYSAYVFSDRPMKLDEKIVIKVLATTSLATGPVEYGVTTCDPSSLCQYSLPINTEELLDLPDYWVVKSDSCHYNPNDILIFNIDTDGKFMLMRNGTSVSTVLHVEVTQPLWLFLKLRGSISSICLLGSSTTDYAAIMKKFQNPNQLQLISRKGKSQDLSSGEPSSSGNGECVICCEKQVNCALYRCGHMCMCYECARNLWQPGVDAQCPICRDTIRDIIKVYT